MKKIALFIAVTVLFSAIGFSADTKAEKKSGDINLGKVYFPKTFVHDMKDYKRGVYRVILTEKDGVPYFKVMNKKKEFLFNEMAVVKPYKGKYKKFKYRVKKELLKEYEYFRIKVTKPDNMIMAYFMIKKKEPKKKK